MFGYFIFLIFLLLPLSYKLLYTQYYLLREPKDNLVETNIKAHAKQEEEQVDINHLWSELDPNMLGEILERLCFADQVRFHVVYKNWLHVHKFTPFKKPLLWYLTFDRDLLGIQLHDSSSLHPASVQNISFTKLGISSPAFYKKVSSIFLKHNWLLIRLVK